MKTLKLQQNSDEWFEARKGKITGSKLSDIIVKRGNKKKIGFYQLIADRIAVEADDEDPRDRGHRLEEEALKLFEEKHGDKLEQVGMWISDDNKNIAVSPDASFDNGKQAVEVKCLSSARHLQAVIEFPTAAFDVPAEFQEQIVQYFIVNEKLETLYLVFYDPRITAKPYHELIVHRDVVEAQVALYKEYQINLLKEVDEWVEKLAF
jgi:putative phage-type endonuclease